MANQTIYWDHERKAVINSTGQIYNAAFPVAYQDKITWDFKVRTVSGTGSLTAVDLSSSTAWRAAVDIDFRYFNIAALLNAAVSAGAVTSIQLKSVTFTANSTSVPSAGVFSLSNGVNSEEVSYSSYSEAGGVYTFTVDQTLSYSYSEDDDAIVYDTAPCCRALDADIDSSDSANGNITVSFDADTAPMLNAISGEENVLGYWELAGSSVSGDQNFYAQSSANLVNLLDPDATGSVPPAPSSQWASKTWVAAGYVNQDLSGTYSAHTTPADADEFFTRSSSASKYITFANLAAAIVDLLAPETFSIVTGGSTGVVDNGDGTFTVTHTKNSTDVFPVLYNDSSEVVATAGFTITDADTVTVDVSDLYPTGAITPAWTLLIFGGTGTLTVDGDNGVPYALTQAATVTLNRNNGFKQTITLTGSDNIAFDFSNLNKLNGLELQIVCSNYSGTASFAYNWDDLSAWSAGAYNTDDTVKHEGRAYISTADSNTEEPSPSATDWDLINAVHFDYENPALPTDGVMVITFERFYDDDGVIKAGQPWTKVSW